MMANGEPIEMDVPAMYQERAEGINPMCDPRTDRFEEALKEQGKAVANHIAKRQERANLGKEGETGNAGGEQAPADKP